MGKRPRRRFDMQTRFIKAKRRNMVYASPGVHDCVLILDGLKPTFNIGKIFRAADAFGVREIHLVGIEFFDPYPSKGSVRWVPFVQHDDFDSCYQILAEKGYSFYAMEPGENSRLVGKNLAVNSAFILGHEEFGFSFNRADYSQIDSVSIPQWGNVQSLNVSVAASIVLYEYIRQHGQEKASVQAAQEVAA
ncbi:MAG: TrmH family RNA methyltransferase [Desulfobulbaceae bacterium]|nr:TrmH family RNA methyltransferase [Desulfobulbaceae bacterium]